MLNLYKIYKNLTENHFLCDDKKTLLNTKLLFKFKRKKPYFQEEKKYFNLTSYEIYK